MDREQKNECYETQKNKNHQLNSKNRVLPFLIKKTNMAMQILMEK